MILDEESPIIVESEQTADGKRRMKQKNYGNEFLTETNGAEDADLQVGLKDEEISTRYFLGITLF